MRFHPALRRAGAFASASLIVAGMIGLAPGGTAGAAEGDFVTGSGNAQAQLVRVGPAAGHLALAPTIGLSLADYLNTLGRGESRIFEWGALDGSVPQGFKDQTPSVRSQSTDEAGEKGADGSFVGVPAGAPFATGLAQQHADSTKQPYGHSTFRLAAFTVPGAIEFSGGIAESTVGVKDGVRQAVGSVRIGELALGGGVVDLTGLKWEAVQRSGGSSATTGTFTVQGATVGGQKIAPPQTPDQVPGFFAQLNAALAPTGLVLDPPVNDSGNGIGSISPLGVRIVNSPAGQTAVAPVVGALQPVRQPITDGLIANAPNASSAVLVADVFTGVLTGGGRMDVELGGATGYTEGNRYENPFAFDLGGFGGDLGASNDFADGSSFASSDLGGSSLSGTPSSYSSSLGGAVPAAGAASPTGAKAAARPAAQQALTASATGAPAGHVGKKGGAAALVGLAGLLGALGLAAADYRTIRVGRRTITI